MERYGAAIQHHLDYRQTKFSYCPTSPHQPNILLAFSTTLTLSEAAEHETSTYLHGIAPSTPYSPVLDKARCNSTLYIDALSHRCESGFACPYYSCQIDSPSHANSHANTSPTPHQIPVDHAFHTPFIRPAPHKPDAHPPLHHITIHFRRVQKPTYHAYPDL